jgi:SAM-dependent methyltransferase
MTYQTDLWDVDEAAFRSSTADARVRMLDERSAQIAHARLPFDASGWCAVCDAITPIRFRSDHGLVDADNGMFHIAFSETGVCMQCMVNSRQRFAVEMLGRRPSSSRIFVSEHVTPLRAKLAERFPALVSSEYLGDYASGAIVNGLRHEDLHALSFDDRAFDAVLCLDVLEHVDDPLTCLGEIARILAPGGIAVVTFPFFFWRSESVRRAALQDGAIRHLLPAEHHGNPLGGGALVFWELTWDLVRDAVQALPLRVRLVQYWSAINLHLGATRFALLLERAAE